MNPNYHARPYQLEARDAILAGLKNVQRGLLVVPTGGGKNFIAASLIDALPRKRILFLADRNELIDQPYKAFNEFLGIDAGVEKAEQHCDVNDRVVVGSIQSMARRYKQFDKGRWDLIIADEAHLSMSKSWQNVLGYFEAQVLGMTATPFRGDAQNLMKFYEAEWYRKVLNDLQDDGWLVGLEIEELSEPIDVNGLTIKHSEDGKKFDEAELSDRIEPHLRRIARDLKAKCPGRHILAFLPLVVIAEKFAQIARSEGIEAQSVHGQDPFRTDKLEMFKRGEIPLLCNSQLVHTGFDAPVCDATLNLTPMFSTVRYQQIIGRSTRPLKGVVDDPEMTAADRVLSIEMSPKPNALVIDPMWQFGEHGLQIPESLSATTEEDAIRMRKYRGRTGKRNLQEINSQVLAEKEAEMLARLRERERREEGVMSSREFAILTGNHFLANYEPVYTRDKAKLSNFEKGMLRSRGIDPETVSGRGECDLVCREINKRRARGLAEIPLLIELASLGKGYMWALRQRDAQTMLRRLRRRTATT